MIKNSSEPRVTLRDAARVHCAKGIKAFCRERGIDFRDFARNGIPLADAQAMHDGNVDLIIAKMRARESGSGG